MVASKAIFLSGALSIAFCVLTQVSTRAHDNMTAAQVRYCKSSSCAFSHKVGNTAEALYFVVWCQDSSGATFAPKSMNCSIDGPNEIFMESSLINAHTCLFNDSYADATYTANANSVTCSGGGLQPDG